MSDYSTRDHSQDQNFGKYLADRLENGWTEVRLKGNIDDVNTWLKANLGDGHPTEDWGPARDHEMWELTMINPEDETYDALFRHKDAAVLAKLTWG